MKSLNKVREEGSTDAGQFGRNEDVQRINREELRGINLRYVSQVLEGEKQKRRAESCHNHYRHDDLPGNHPQPAAFLRRGKGKKNDPGDGTKDADCRQNFGREAELKKQASRKRGDKTP